jgi:hypothetical protein
MQLHPRIRSVQAGPGFTLLLGFADGTSGTVDLTDDVDGRSGVFAPLQDPGYFARVIVDDEAGTVVWPNGLDLDPDVLYQRAHGIVTR